LDRAATLLGDVGQVLKLNERWVTCRRNFIHMGDANIDEFMAASDCSQYGDVILPEPTRRGGLCPGFYGNVRMHSPTVCRGSIIAYRLQQQYGPKKPDYGDSQTRIPLPGWAYDFLRKYVVHPIENNLLN
jgi:hypothetical protein